LVIAWLGAGASARAQADPSIAVAEALFQQARALAGQEKWAEACPKFAESQRLDPKLGTLLNLAHCHEQEGKTATAWAEYTSAASLARRVGRKDREDFARERVEDLEKKLAHVVIRMEAPPPGLRVLLDDKPIDAAALGTPLPIDPGKHVFTATAPGKKGFSAEVEVPPSPVEIPLALPVLEPDATSPANPANPATPPEPPGPPPNTRPPPLTRPAPPSGTPPVSAVPEDPRRRRARILMLTGFTVGAAGAVVGAVTGIATLAKADEILPNCNGLQCSTDQADNIATANLLANVSNVGFGVSAMFMVAGIWGVVILPKARNTQNPVAVTPFVGPGEIGVRGAF
jgi:hypothetical protein